MGKAFLMQKGAIMNFSERTYKELTGIDIQEQKDLWDERGKGYYGEFLVFTTLFDFLKDNSKILMNIEIPKTSGETTEIDLLLIHESGLYCFEMKHYKGDIYCNFEDKYWVQAFRTTENHRFYSPVWQNSSHIRALKNMFPNVPIQSFIIFTHEYVTLHEGKHKTFDYEQKENATICTLDWFKYRGSSEINNGNIIFDTDEIDTYFKRLEPYSKIQQQYRLNDGKIIGFAEYINTFHPVYCSILEKSKK